MRSARPLHAVTAAIAALAVIGSTLFSATSLSGCKASPPAGSEHPASTPLASAQAPSPSASAAGGNTVVHASLPYTEIMTGGAQTNDAVPLIVALHGLGDSPERFLAVFSAFRAPARIVAPHSLTPYDTGYSWFDVTNGLDQSAPEIATMATTVATFATEMARARPTLGKPIVMGFSQGGALSFEIGVHHASSVAATFPVGGWLSPSLWPTTKPATPSSAVTITLFHGMADQRVPFAGTKAAVAHLQQLGFPVELHEYPGVGHGISPSLGADLLRAITNECEKQRQAGSSDLSVQH